MIRRSHNSYSENQESLTQHSFAALKGIDGSQVATSQTTVLNAVNLDVDHDGGLILRKPIVFNKLYDCDILHYAYNDEPLIVKGNKLQGWETLKTTDIYGNRFETAYSEAINAVLDFSNCKFVNTSSTTIVNNVSVNLTKLGGILAHSLKTGVEDDIQPRMFRMFKEDTWILEMVTPEINHITFDDIALDFNTTLNNPLAVRDDYNAVQTSIKGILGYALENERVYQDEIIQSKTVEADGNQIFDCGDYGKITLVFAPDTNTEKLVTGIGVIKNNYFSNTIAFSITVYYSDKDGTRITKVYTITKDQFSAGRILNSDVPITCTEATVNIARAYVSVQTPNILSLTESKQFKILNGYSDSKPIVLKAFLDNPVGINNIFIKWEASKDGITWNTVSSESLKEKYINIARPDITVNDVSDTKTLKWNVEHWWELPSESNFSLESEKNIDKCTYCLIIPEVVMEDVRVVKCSLIKAKPKSESTYPTTEGFPEDTSYVYDYELDSKTYIFNNKDSELLNHDFKNPLTGDMLYWKHSLYSVSSDFKNNVYVSNPDSSVFPVSRIIDLGAYKETTITKLIPWRDYLLAFTKNTVHIIKEQDVGFTTKVVNTFIGVSEYDSDTCVSILNGVIFKTGNRLYTLTPNYTSSDDSILNISDISKPIAHIIESLPYNTEYKPFAFTSSEDYYLFIPITDGTVCLKYNYTKKLWTQYVYDKIFTNFRVFGTDDIRLFANENNGISEYYFEKTTANYNTLDTYGDVLDASTVAPIRFFVDSGQKTDNISLTKRFVESKIVIATLSSKDTFKVEVSIDVDGNLVKRHIDLNTSGALLRESSNQILTLGSALELSETSDIFNVMRQMLIRYSGKGKTIRHIISGESLYKFKIYEVFYRYKLPIVKQ